MLSVLRYHHCQVKKMQETVRELQSELRVYKDSEQTVPVALTRGLEQRIKRLEAELEVSEEQRRQASQELVRLQSQFSEIQHLNKGRKEELVQEVRKKLTVYCQLRKIEGSCEPTRECDHMK